MDHAPVLSIVNTKGGVGKTTTAVHLAAAAAECGHRTLLVDLDPDAWATACLLVDGAEAVATTADVLLRGAPAVGAATTTPLLDLLPSVRELADANATLLPKVGREKVLARALAHARERYDLVVIDCPPGLSLLPVNALVACTHYLVPVTPEFLAMEGLRQLFADVEQLTDAMDGQCGTLVGVVVTRADYRSRFTRQAIDQLRAELGPFLLGAVVRTSVALNEAQAHGQTVFQYAPSSAGALAYRELATQVAAELRLRPRLEVAR